LIYVIILVALATYLTVFNLNTIVRLCTTTYESRKEYLVGKMKSDSTSEYWKSKGARFETFHFRPKSDVVKPSEWLLVAYAFRRAMHLVFSSLIRQNGSSGATKFLEPGAQTGNREMDRAPNRPETSTLNKIGKLFRRS